MHNNLKLTEDEIKCLYASLDAEQRTKWVAYLRKLTESTKAEPKQTH